MEMDRHNVSREAAAEIIGLRGHWSITDKHIGLPNAKAAEGYLVP